MKKIVKNVWIAGGSGARDRANTIYERLFWAAAQEETALLARYGTAATGLTTEQVERSREEHGSNVLTYGKRESVAKRLFSAFINPFTAILLALAAISAVTDIALASPGEKNYATVLIIATMVLLSGGAALCPGDPQRQRGGQAAGDGCAGVYGAGDGGKEKVYPPVWPVAVAAALPQISPARDA